MQATEYATKLTQFLDDQFPGDLSQPPKGLVRQIKEGNKVLCYKYTYTTTDAQDSALLARAYLQANEINQALTKTWFALYFQQMESSFLKYTGVSLGHTRGLEGPGVDEVKRHVYGLTTEIWSRHFPGIESPSFDLVKKV